MDKKYQITKNLCSNCVKTCEYCGISVCMGCKLCLCNIDKLHIDPSKKNKGPSKITEAASLKAIVCPKPPPKIKSKKVITMSKFEKRESKTLLGKRK